MTDYLVKGDAMTLAQDRIDDIIATDGASITDEDRAEVRKMMLGQDLADHEIFLATTMGMI
uniref:hypothetical protein n=1 Tax=Paenarthrobacter ureafaciens TaxID=37931 RepID=UPI003F49AF10